MNILAVIAAVILAFAAFGAHLADVNLLYLALAFWALSMALPVVLPLRRR